MSEAKLSRTVRNLFESPPVASAGFRVWSTEQGYRKERGGTRCTPGIPDLLIIGPGIAAYVELKFGKGKLSPAQKDFRDHCTSCEVEWHCWRHVDDAFEWLVDMGVLEELYDG